MSKEQKKSEKDVTKSLFEAQRAYFTFVGQFRSRTTEFYNSVVLDPIVTGTVTKHRMIHFVHGIPSEGIYWQVVSVSLRRQIKDAEWHTISLVHTDRHLLTLEVTAHAYDPKVHSEDARLYFVPEGTSSDDMCRLIPMEARTRELEATKLPPSPCEPFFPK
jgi:hypothetical protein